MRKIVYILSLTTLLSASYAAVKTPAIEKRSGDPEILTLDARIDYDAPEKTGRAVAQAYNGGFVGQCSGSIRIG